MSLVCYDWVQFGMDQISLVWFSLDWYGSVWFGMVEFGLVWMILVWKMNWFLFRFEDEYVIIVRAQAQLSSWVYKLVKIEVEATATTDEEV